MRTVLLLNISFEYLIYKHDIPYKLFTRTCSDRTQGNGFTLKGSRLRLIRKKNPYCELAEALDQVVNAPLPRGI